MVPKDSNFYVIRFKWIYKIKYNADEQINQHKVKLVAKGFIQQEGFDFHETFSPIIKHTTIKFLLSITISQNWYIHQIDILNAFLHDEIDELIYMK